jgi:hypothetical protein
MHIEKTTLDAVRKFLHKENSRFDSNREISSVDSHLNIIQPDPYTCQSACLAMALNHPDVYGIRKRLLDLGDPGNWEVMKNFIKSDYPETDYELRQDATLLEARQWLENEEFLVTHGWFTSSGHVICLDGVTDYGDHIGFSVKDPWSQFDAPNWSYDINVDFYDGNYSDCCIYAACVVNDNRIIGSREAYLNGSLNWHEHGMIIHRFK